jgi:phosphohistidine swiveling domain-containing protein
MPQGDDPKPGYKWPVAVVRPIAAPGDKVWEVISMPGNLEHCHPFCAENPVQVWPGDILVTKGTDPGWTTLFLNAGGVLLESGGTQQHGASVTRELGKPCTVGIDRVTKILTDGQTVELDGATGLIKIPK